MARKGKTDKPTKEDIGAAMMAWYAEAIRNYPEGLITQAQAATMLGVSRVAVSRLVSRGYLRAVYFPKPPDIEGIAIGRDDPTLIKVVGWLALAIGERDHYAFPQACYVSFGDVLDLWESGTAKDKCKRDWNEIFAVSRRDSKLRLREIHQKYQHMAVLERAERERQKLKEKEEADGEG